MRGSSRAAAPILFLALFLIFPIAPSARGADDLKGLAQDYAAAKQKARGGNPDERKQKAMSQLKPILLKIAKLDTQDALAFLRREFETESPEIGMACVEPLLAHSSDKVLEILFFNFPKRPKGLKQEILAALGKSKRSLAPLEGTLAGLLGTETLPEVRREIPALLGRIDTIAAAKSLLGSLQASRARDSEKAQEEAEEYQRRVVEALKGTKNSEVKDWLGGAAFSGAPPARQIVLAGLAGELKLEPARPELEKLLSSPEDGVAVAALEALGKIGSAASAPKILEGLKKGKRGIAFRIQALDALASSGNEGAVAVVVEAAKDSDADTRAIAMGSLSRVPGSSKAAFEAILGGLKDAEPNVRSAAVRALLKIRSKDMVPALIDALGAEKEEKLKVDILTLLIELTGKNMGFEVEDWKKWWEVAAAKFEFSKDEKKVTAAKATDLKYFGIEVSSKRLAFLVDTSSSMTEQMTVYLTPEKNEPEPEPGKTQGLPSEEEKGKKKREGPKSKARKIDVLKKELARVIGGLPRDAQINIVNFDVRFKSWQDSLQPLAGGGKEKAQAYVRALQTGVGTNVFDTLEFALKDRRVDTIFLLTDGLPTRGRFTDPAAIRREVGAMNRIRGVAIHCIAFGEESQFLKDLAKENGGVYRFVDSY